jgi:surface carbohydrate biosynthesis protein
MPLVSEQISLPVLFRAWTKLRISRWGYYQAFVEMTGARVALVWHDTNIAAYQLRHHIQIPVFCVQNGVRHNLAPASGRGFRDQLQRTAISRLPTADAYFCFGRPEPIYFANFIRTTFIPHGSLRANAYAVLRKDQNRDELVNGIGFIVSFPNRQSVPGESIVGNQEPFMRIGSRVLTYQEYFSFDAVVARAISAVCKQRNLRFSVIGKRSDQTSPEIQYFQDCVDNQLDVLTHTKGDGYEVAERFRYLVTIDSTLGYEMRALGKPVAFLSNRLKHLDISDRDLTFGFPLHLSADGPYWSSATTEPEIVQFLHLWIDSEVSQKTQKDSFELMHLDPGNTQLRGMIHAALENAS